MVGHLVYTEEREPFRGRPVPYHNQDAVRYWRTHYANFKFLSFVASHSQEFAERRQAEREIVICQRRMDHWQRHVNWSADAGARARAEEDDRWRERSRRQT